MDHGGFHLSPLANLSDAQRVTNRLLTTLYENVTPRSKSPELTVDSLGINLLSGVQVHYF